MENEIQPNIPQVQPLPQAPAPVPNQPSTNWSKIMLFAVLGLIVIAGSVFVGIQIGSNQTPNQQPIVTLPTTSPTQIVVNPTIQPTTNMKTYKNSSYGITFNYPDGYTIESEMNRNDGSFLYEIQSPLDPNYDPEMRGTAGLGENELGIAFAFTKNSSSISLDDYLTEFKKETLLDGFSKITKTESIVVNNQKIYFITFERPQSPIKKTALLLNNYTLVEVTMEPVGSSRETEFSKILSTFKFTN